MSAQRLKQRQITVLLVVISVGWISPTRVNAGGPIEVKTELDDPVCAFSFRSARECHAATFENVACPLDQIPKKSAKDFFPKYDVNLSQNEIDRLNQTFLQACRMGCGSRRAKHPLPNSRVLCLQLGLIRAK